MAQLLELQKMPEVAKHARHGSGHGGGGLEISTLSLLLCG